MLYTLATVGLTTLFVIITSDKILRNIWLFRRYKKLSNGIPFIADFNPLTTHLASVLLGRNNCNKIQRAHAKLGPYLAYLTGEQLNISTTDLDLIKQVVVDDAHLNLDRMSLNLPMSELEKSIMLLPGEKWRPVRRVFAPALRPNKFKARNVVQELEGSIGKLIQHIDGKLDALEKQKCGKIEVHVDDMVQRYSLDLVFSCFYKQYNLIDFEATVCAWSRAVDSLFQDIRASSAVILAMIFPWIRPLMDWFVWHFHKHGTMRRKILGFVKLQLKLGIEARRPSGSTNKSTTNSLPMTGATYRRNIIDHIIDAFQDGKLTRSDYLNSSCFFLLAAQKTTTDCLVHTLYLLSIHPDVQERLRAIVNVDGAESEYLNWVLLESMRLLPPSPGGSQRVLGTSYAVNVSIGGERRDYVIPKNAFLAPNAFVIHRLKEYWGEDAEEFRPDRWADTSNHHPMQFIAFGAGPRNCLGREFAMFTMKSLLAALLARYKFEGKPRADAYDVTSPAMIFIEPNSATRVTISRL